MTESKLHGIGLIKKVHETKIFRNLGENQALQVQDNTKKPQPLCKSWTVLWKLFREKAQTRWISRQVLSVTCKKINMPTIFVSTHNIFKNTYSARNQGSITEAKMKPKEKVVNAKYLFMLFVGNDQVLMSTFWKKNRGVYIKYCLLQYTCWLFPGTAAVWLRLKTIMFN